MYNPDQHVQVSGSSNEAGVRREGGIKENEGSFAYRDDQAYETQKEDEEAVRYIENPLAVKSREAVIRDVKRFVQEVGITDDEEVFIKGALVARDPDNFENIPELTDEDKAALRKEVTHRWHQPFMMYFLVGTNTRVSRHDG